jgi:RND family efflux transporter MFP subunit
MNLNTRHSCSWTVTTAALTVAAALTACRPANEFAPPPPAKVTVARPAKQQVVLHREFTGRTAAFESVDVRARVPGYLQQVHFEEGKQVDEGDLLFTIEQAPYEASLAAARAQLDTALAEVEETKFDYDKTKGLYERENASQQELVMSKAAYDSAEAAKLAAQAAVDSAQLDLGYTEIKAPIAGRIGRRLVDAGNLVGQREPTLLTTIVRWSPIYVYFTVSERDVLELLRERAASSRLERAHIEVYVRLADGSDYPTPGVVDFADNRVDSATGTVQVRAVFENADEILVPGIFARVRVPSKPVEALLVPDAALQRDLSGYFVLVVDDGGQVERRDVEIGDLLGKARQITHGLDGSELVIVKGLQRAREGATVEADQTTFEPEIHSPGASDTGGPGSRPAGTQPAGDE